ncbi:MAG: protein kinase [Sandaracinaceae bacterium]|nr:protein kinase [Sandaracinaceae bacterium]
MSIRCPSCGEDNRDEARFCSRCGSGLEARPGADPLLGQLVQQRYRIVDTIGEGGMGRVYLAEQQMGTATRRVALKVLHPKLGREERVRKRFYRECEVVIQLTHPNTIQFFDFGELRDGRLFIVMEYAEGPTLADVLAAGALPIERADHIFEQIAGSLHEAHEKGVVHRDLKPDNIILTSRGGVDDFVKVCDFGIAQRRGEGPEITLEGTIIGTPQYMSPEQLSGAEVDARSDIYSLGLVLFEMVAGTRPFHADTPLQWATLHTTAAPPSLELYPAARGLAPHRKDAIYAALAKSPRDRPQTARELASRFLGREVGRITTPQSERPPHVDPVAPTVPSGAYEPAGVRPLWRVLAALLFVVGLAGLGAAGYLQRERVAAWLVPPPPPEPLPTDWLRIVHFERSVENAANALGPPDGRFATLPPQGTLVLELRAGVRIASNGTGAPDVAIVIDEARSGPYRLDVGVDRNQYTTVGWDLVGTLELDVDQYAIARVRYIRLKNRGELNVYVDAVGTYRTVRVE